MCAVTSGHLFRKSSQNYEMIANETSVVQSTAMSLLLADIQNDSDLSIAYENMKGSMGLGRAIKFVLDRLEISVNNYSNSTDIIAIGTLKYAIFGNIANQNLTADIALIELLDTIEFDFYPKFVQYPFYSGIDTPPLPLVLESVNGNIINENIWSHNNNLTPAITVSELQLQSIQVYGVGATSLMSVNVEIIPHLSTIWVREWKVKELANDQDEIELVNPVFKCFYGTKYMSDKIQSGDSGMWFWKFEDSTGPAQLIGEGIGYEGSYTIILPMTTIKQAIEHYLQN